MHVPLTLSTVRTTARITALRPGQSPPPVKIPIRFMPLPPRSRPFLIALMGDVAWNDTTLRGSMKPVLPFAPCDWKDGEE